MKNKARSHLKRQRRLAIRLAISTETLLRLTLGVPLPAERSHALPLRPSEVLQLLGKLAAGTPIEQLEAGVLTEGLEPIGDSDEAAP